MNKSSEMAPPINAAGLDPHGSTEAFGIRPSFDHVLLLKPKHGVTERNGLFMPEMGRNDNEAEVVAVGPGRLHDGVFLPVHVRPGDKVVLAQAAYHPISVSVQVEDKNKKNATYEETVNLLIVKEGLIIARIAPKTTLLNAKPPKMYGYGNDEYQDGP